MSAVFLATPPAAAAPFFQPIGTLPTGTFSRVGGISPDGTVVVGESNENLPGVGLVNRAIRWEAGTVTSLGSLTVDPLASIGLDASFDGAVIVGHERQAVGLGYKHVGWRWEAGVMTQLPFVAPGDSSSAQAVSDDGTTIVGYADVGGAFQNAVRWENGIPGNAGTATGDDNDLSGMTGVSGDGTVASGSSKFPGGAYHGFRNDGAFTDVGTLDGVFISNGEDISGDGEVVVGESQRLGGGLEAFRWEAGVMAGLGDLPGGDLSSTAFAVDEDGDVIVGRGQTALGDEAFLWTDSNGIVNLKSALEGAGLDLTGWTLSDAVAVSYDGLIIAGNGINPTGQMEGWVASVPEPGTLAFMLFAGVFGAVHRKR